MKSVDVLALSQDYCRGSYHRRPCWPTASPPSSAGSIDRHGQGKSEKCAMAKRSRRATDGRKDQMGVTGDGRRVTNVEPFLRKIFVADHEESVRGRRCSLPGHSDNRVWPWCLQKCSINTKIHRPPELFRHRRGDVLVGFAPAQCGVRRKFAIGHRDRVSRNYQGQCQIHQYCGVFGTQVGNGCGISCRWHEIFHHRTN